MPLILSRNLRNIHGQISQPLTLLVYLSGCHSLFSRIEWNTIIYVCNVFVWVQVVLWYISWCSLRLATFLCIEIQMFFCLRPFYFIIPDPLFSRKKYHRRFWMNWISLDLSLLAELWHGSEFCNVFLCFIQALTVCIINSYVAPNVRLTWRAGFLQRRVVIS